VLSEILIDNQIKHNHMETISGMQLLFVRIITKCYSEESRPEICCCDSCILLKRHLLIRLHSIIIYIILCLEYVDAINYIENNHCKVSRKSFILCVKFTNKVTIPEGIF